MKSSPKSKQIIRDRTRLEWVLLVALLLIAYLLLATRYEWWPWSSSSPNLGTAFYVYKDKDASSSDNSSSDGSGGSGGNGDSNNDGGGNGGGGGGSSSNSPLLTFAAGIDRGDTKESVSGEGRDLDENCAILINTDSAGKQEVCTYREGDKLITVTYLNDRVISASRSGF